MSLHPHLWSSTDPFIARDAVCLAACCCISQVYGDGLSVHCTLIRTADKCGFIFEDHNSCYVALVAYKALTVMKTTLKGKCAQLEEFMLNHLWGVIGKLLVFACLVFPEALFA